MHMHAINKTSTVRFKRFSLNFIKTAFPVPQALSYVYSTGLYLGCKGRRAWCKWHCNELARNYVLCSLSIS